MSKYILDGVLEFDRRELQDFFIEILEEDIPLAERILPKYIKDIKTPSLKARKIAARACKFARDMGYNVEMVRA